MRKTKKRQNKKTKKRQNKKTKKRQNKKTKKRQIKNMKKGGMLLDLQKKSCINYDGKNYFTIKDEMGNIEAEFGDKDKSSIKKTQAENLSMFSNNTCFRTDTMAEYLRYLVNRGIGPGHDKFVTPTEPFQKINQQMLHDFGIKYDKDSPFVPKELVEAFNVVEPDTDYRPPDIKEEEERLRCILLRSTDLYSFVSNMWFGMIQTTLGLPPRPDGTQQKDWLEKVINTTYHKDSVNKTIDTNVISKPGYLCDIKNDCTKILDFQSADEFYSYNIYNKISFLQLMGAFYDLPWNQDFITGLIDNDEELQDQFMTTIKQFFRVPDTMTYDDYSTIINNSYTEYPRFHPWVYTFLVNRKPNLVHQLKSGDDDVYLRRRLKGNNDLFKTPVKNIKCKENQFDNYGNSKLELVFGNTYVTPRDNGIWYNTLKLYEKQMIAGPSGSSVYLYQMMFDLSKILVKDKKNEIMLLMAILADYTGVYHSTTEILQVYAEESSFIEPKYHLGMIDTDYIRELMIQVDIDPT
jgi:hypothetical protein